jgi:hypothetical protein
LGELFPKRSLELLAEVPSGQFWLWLPGRFAGRYDELPFERFWARFGGEVWALSWPQFCRAFSWQSARLFAGLLSMSLLARLLRLRPESRQRRTLTRWLAMCSRGGRLRELKPGRVASKLE